ncbi:hypothetical protein PVK06_018163 [Gossypium arboreum]|uniref:RNase H type-1 domain-containing protein n=1 Tax=Gossypium arboreum TaxID=29729 RepID=A0ABR0Q538_GOSAR|nr:hypothetical protein PVK06_018163 [Gossypium arboreum]
MSMVWMGIVENAKDSKVAKWMDRLPTKEFLTRRGVRLYQLERGCSWFVQKSMVDFGDSGMLSSWCKGLHCSEIGAIIIALDVYLAMGWKGKGSLIIEIGSNEVFSWIENKRLRPWMLQSIFKDIENRMHKVGNVSFSKAEKHGNEMASALALVGIKRHGMFKACW